MRTLVVGAGAVGGYFGGRLVEAGRDVTFLVRPRRAEELSKNGLRIQSRMGDLHVPSPKTVLSENLKPGFDLVLLSCKAYDLENAIESFAPAVGPHTMIVPLLNGMRHLDTLVARFGEQATLGGVSRIAATLNDARDIVHLNEIHGLSFGERPGGMSDRVREIDELMKKANFDVDASENILLEMWEKWVFLAALAAGTCLMRAAVGDIAASPGGSALMLQLLDECRSIAAEGGVPPRDAFLDRTRATLTAAGSPITASMLRDVENKSRTEADHVIGDLLQRARPGTVSLLPIAYAHLKAYEARRARTA